MTEKNNTPNCPMHELLVTYLYGEASGAEASRFEAHLQTCASCSQELLAFENVRESLQQWQLEDLPNVRVVIEPPRRSALALLKELFAVMPLWAKGAGAFAAALVLFAVLGLDVRIGGGEGFQMRADLFRTRSSAPALAPSVDGTALAVTLDDEQLNKLRSGLLKEVEARIAESEKLRQDELQARLVKFEEQVRAMRPDDLLKLANRVQEHNVKLKAIERDMDRREGMGLSDILFSDATATPNERSSDKTGDE